LASCALLLFGGIANAVSGVESEGLNLWGAAVGMLAMYLVVVFVWKRIGALRAPLDRLAWPIWIKFVLIGWLFAELDELVNFPFNPLAPGITLLEDIVLTTPMYVLGHLGWYWTLRRFHLSLTEALVTGGLALGLFEVFSGGIGPAVLLVLFVLPFLIMIHGVHMVMPPMFLEGHLSLLKRVETRWKYPLGVLIPAVGVLLGIGLAYLIQLPVHYLLGT
jgi:hypothetical protein